jgi:uncharacterized protein YidB (DUF937 family)
MNWIKWLFGLKAGSSNPNQPIEPNEAQKILDLIGDYFQKSGGLANVLKRFEQSGFMSKVRSWVSTGPNQPINSVEALQLFGLRNLSEMASKAGISVERLRDLLAELLPVAIDKATPLGKL